MVALDIDRGRTSCCSWLSQVKSSKRKSWSSRGKERSEDGSSKGAFGHHLPYVDQGLPFRGSLSSTYGKEITFGAGHPLIGS